MSLARLSAGAGYRYLLRHTACGDVQRDAATPLTAYYAASGYPPGRWLGSGLSGVDGGRGLAAGTVVSEEAMAALYGAGGDPVSGAPLGKAYPSFKPVAQRIADAVAQLPPTLTGQERAARVARIEQAERSRPVRTAVAGFDLTFTAPKSASVLWALGDPAVQQAVTAAHREALEAALAVVEERALYTRVGARSCAQVPTRGMIAAAFDHWDTRTSDPSLHTHMVVANKVLGRDGVWRSLDSRALHHAAVAISELYDDLFADALVARLPVGWGWRDRGERRTPAFEIDGIDDGLLTAFSGRSEQVDAHLRKALADFRASHGRAPTRVEVLRLRQRATRVTRPAKSARPLTDLLTRWRETAVRLTGRSPDELTAAALHGHAMSRRRLRAAQLPADVIDRLAETTLEGVAQRRSTWTRWNLVAEAARASRGLRLRTPADRLTAVDRIVGAAMTRCVPLDPPDLITVPGRFRHPDGSSVFTRPAERAYTTEAILAAEERLLAAADTLGAPALPDIPDVTVHGLTADQRAAVTAIAGSGRLLDVLVGPAGTGKTRTLAALRRTWEAVYGSGSVVGLAPSAGAAQELGEALGVPCETAAKWLHETVGPGGQRRRAVATQLAARRTGHPVGDRRLDGALQRLAAEQGRWTLHPGQLLIVDEASMLATHPLDHLVRQAAGAHAKVLLVGDHHQLDAVEAGGAFRLLADTGTPATLKALWRFRNRWEATATRRLRDGDPAALHVYAQHGRLHDGPAETMLDDAYTAWRADIAQGRAALLMAGDRDTVAALNQRARDDRVAAGHVQPDGVHLADGTVAGCGDLIVTRRNDRRLRLAGGGYVRNGARWQVTAVHGDGSLDVTPVTPGTAAGAMYSVLHLPGGYVREHVELGYATTVHRAQGMTVDAAHVLITPGMTRQAVYVAMTRGRTANHAYITTDAIDPTCPDPVDGGDAPNGRQVLQKVLETDGGELSATATLRQRYTEATALSHLVPIRTTLAAAASRERWERLLTTTGLDPAMVTAVITSPAATALYAALDELAKAGHDAVGVVAHLTAAMTGAGDSAAGLRARVRHWLDQATPTGGAGCELTIPETEAACYATAIRDLDELIHDRVDAIRRQLDDEQRHRLLAQHGASMSWRAHEPPSP